jgi:hypothetical protein
MSNMQLRPLLAFAVVSVAAVLIAACGKVGTPPAASGAGAPQDTGAERSARQAAPDPCTLLSASEAQPYVGVVSPPPYEASDGLAQVGGDQCIYRGTGARQLVITRTGEGSAAAASSAREASNTVGGALEKAGAGNLAATSHRVIAQVPNGPWDQANWIPGGTLFVTKGDQGTNVDVSSAGGKEDDAVAIARLIVPRFDHPLDYDGAKAVAGAPKPAEHPANACEVVPRSAVEGAIGALDGSATPDPDGSKCTYHVASAQGPRNYPIEFVWQGGLKNFNMLKNGMSTLGSVMGGSIPTAGMDSMKMDPNMSKMIGGLMKMAGGGGAAAPGAATEVGFKTDTTLQGPWDSAMLLHGTQLLAVKSDVMVGMDLQSADYEKAKALLAVVCSALKS